MTRLCEGCSARGDCSGEIASIVNADLINRYSFQEVKGAPRTWTWIILEDEEGRASKAVVKRPELSFTQPERLSDVTSIIESCPNQGLPADEQDPAQCKFMEGREVLDQNVSVALGYLARQDLS